MLDRDAVQAAADTLWKHWRERRRMAALPAAVRPTTRAEGYAIQAALGSREAAPAAGWKIAATSAAGQAHIGVDGPVAGRLFASRVHAGGAPAIRGDTHMAVAEAEFAFRFGTALPARAAAYSVPEVLAAVDSLHPAIEVPDSRYDDFAVVGAAQLIADNACAHEFVLGPAAPARWRGVDLATHPTVARVAGGAAHAGSGGAVLGDPRVALTWLVNELSGLGIDVRPGEIATTGTTTTPVPIAPGDTVTADLGALGSVRLRVDG